MSTGACRAQSTGVTSGSSVRAWAPLTTEPSLVPLQLAQDLNVETFKSHTYTVNRKKRRTRPFILSLLALFWKVNELDSNSIVLGDLELTT